MRGAEFEQVIIGAPEVVENYLVYADWLVAQGDPRGELIAVEHQLSREPDNAVLQAARARLLEEHRAALLVEQAPTLAGIEVDWRLGFWRSLRLELEPDASSIDGIAAVLAHPSAVLLESLAIHGASNSTGELFRDVVTWLGEHPVGRSLKALAIGSREVAQRWSPNVLEALPRLERLELRASKVHHSYLDWQLPRLLGFTLRVASLGARSVERLCRSLPSQLIELTLDFAQVQVRARDVAALIDGSGFPQLTRLGLLGFEDCVALVDALRRSPLLPQLRAIGLRPRFGWWNEDKLPERLRDPVFADKQLFCSPDLRPYEHYNFGLMLRTELRRPADALAAYELALRGTPDDAATWVEHGNAHEELDHLQEAERSFREALRIEPEDKGAWHNLAIALKRQRRFAEALDAFRRSAKAKPAPSTLHCIGHMLQEVGDDAEGLRSLQEAVDGYGRIIENEDGRTDAVFWRGAAYARMRRETEALADLARAIAADETWREAARTEEDFVDLRDDPRFVKLVSGAGGR